MDGRIGGGVRLNTNLGHEPAVWRKHRQRSFGMKHRGAPAPILGLTTLVFVRDAEYGLGYYTWLVSLAFAFLAGMVVPVTNILTASRRRL